MGTLIVQVLRVPEIIGSCMMSDAVAEYIYTAKEIELGTSYSKDWRTYRLEIIGCSVRWFLSTTPDTVWSLQYPSVVKLTDNLRMRQSCPIESRHPKRIRVRSLSAWLIDVT